METESMQATSEEMSQETSSESQANENEGTGSEESQTKESQKAEEKKAIAAQARRLSDADDDALVTVKINGESKEITVRELKKINQLENVSHQKMREAAEVMKQVQQIVQLAKTNPKEFLKKTGIDPYDFAEATLAEKFEMMNLSPEQKELLETKQRLKSYEEKEEEIRKQAEQEQLSKAELEAQTSLDQEIGEAWKESGLPKTKYMVAQIAARMLSASKQGLKNFTAKDAVASVKDEFRASAKEVIGALEPEAIIDLLGKDVMKKIREYDVKRVTGKASQNSQGPSAKPASQPKKTFKSEHEWRQHLAEMTQNLTD